MKRLRCSLLSVIVALACTSAPLRAQSPATAPGFDPRIERAIAQAGEARGLVFRDRVVPRWLPDGERFWYDVRTGADTREFVLVHAPTGRLRRAATLDALGLRAVAPAKTSTLSSRLRRSRGTGEATAIDFTNATGAPVQLYWLDEGGARQAYGTIAAGASLHRSTYEGHVWLLTREDGTPLATVEATAETRAIEIDGPAPAAPRDEEGDDDRGPRRARRRGATPSPDGRWEVTLREGNVYLAPAPAADDAEPLALTTDGTERHPYLGPVEWAPDSRTFVLTRAQLVDVRTITLVESSPGDQLQPKTREVPYIKPGDPLPSPQPVLFRFEPGDEAAAEPRVRALAVSTELCPTPFTTDGRLDYRWSEDGREVFLDYNQRGHQLYRILAIDAATGAVRTVVEETSRTFIDYTNKTWREWLPGGRELLWMSERDGWAHLWLYDVAGGQPPRQVTRGDWVVRDVVRVDAEKRQVWFMAGGVRAAESPYHQHLCRVNLDGTGFVRLTEGDGTHRIEWSPDRRWFVDAWSRVDQPPITELRRAEDGKLIATLERADISKLLAGGWTAPERFVAKGRDGQTDIHGVIVRPAGFDRRRHYPVVEDTYAGPHGAFAPVGFSLLQRQHALANLGFVVVQADGMGTNFRSRAFHDVAWKNLKDAGFPDRIAWMRAAAAKRPWMDLTRVGIYGTSAGGQTAMRAVLDHADFYRAAVADCGCHDNRMDKIWWNEQWLGWPLDESYVTNSNMEDAARLGGALLLMVGEQDTNVDPASTLQVADRLMKAGKPFEFLLFPGVGHGTAGTPYGQRRLMDFFLRQLTPDS